jgi:non-heme chloroperoxidase
VARNNYLSRLANTWRRKVLGVTRMNANSLPPSAVGKEAEVLTSSTQRMNHMTTITTKDGAQIFYDNWGPKSARPIDFRHGRPMSSDDRDNQMLCIGGAS